MAEEQEEYTVSSWLNTVPLDIALVELRKIQEFNIQLAKWYMTVAEITITEHKKQP